MSEYAGKQFVGIDLHRRRSVVVRTTVCGDVLEATQILNDVDRLKALMEGAGETRGPARGDLRVVLGGRRAPGGGRRVHLAHPWV